MKKKKKKKILQKKALDTRKCTASFRYLLNVTRQSTL